MKAIGIKMVELQPMFSGEARIKGYKVLESLGDNELGYEVTYLDGYKMMSIKNLMIVLINLQVSLILILSLKLFKMKNEKI